MTYVYDPDNWLVSMTRAIGDYVTSVLNDPDSSVEMSFPDTSKWVKETPLANAVVHFEQDAISDPILGFGVPGDDVYDSNAGTNLHREAAMHLVNYDVGVWVSAEAGGGTKRMELVQALKNIFTTATGKQAFNAATEGLWPVSFEGGRNQLDRVNDLPLWRALDMTLVVRCFSRHTPTTPDVVPTDFTQNEQLTISSSDGTDKPVETP